MAKKYRNLQRITYKGPEKEYHDKIVEPGAELSYSHLEEADIKLLIRLGVIEEVGTKSKSTSKS